MSEPYADLGNDLVAVPKKDLETLVIGLEVIWDDHSYAKKENNPGWIRDRAVIRAASKVLKRRALD